MLTSARATAYLEISLTNRLNHWHPLSVMVILMMKDVYVP